MYFIKYVVYVIVIRKVCSLCYSYNMKFIHQKGGYVVIWIKIYIY